MSSPVEASEFLINGISPRITRCPEEDIGRNSATP
jgi:hypothetical protein